MTSSSSTIIRIPRTDTDQEDDFILGEVTRSGAGGSSAGRASAKPLNLKIVATEGEEPYALTLKHDTINSLRSSSSSCTPSEWESILSSLLITASPISDIEAGAEVESRGKKKSITITIRRRVAGINQRLGSLTLSRSPSSEIQLFDWCSQLAISRQTALSSLSTSAAQVADLEARVADLKKQLEELTQAKVDQETELLQKFRALLNEKKGKIRQQQQVISSRARTGSSQDGLSGVIESARAKSATKTHATQPDEDEEEEEEGGAKLGRISGARGATGTAKSRTARVSRPGKRKATKDVSSSDEDDEDSEKMDIDEPEPSSKTMGQSSSSKTLDVEGDHDGNKDEDEEEDEDEDGSGRISGRETPDRDFDDDETASEPDEEDEMAEAGEKDLDVGGLPASPPPVARKGRGAAVSTSKTTTPQKKTAGGTAGTAKGKGKETPTPTKSTPASNTKRAGATATRASQPAVPAKVDEGSETESDDEL
ncbi:hypothetical protein B0T20DRAFT_480709 [Sordaria brevicollis]|uniref:Mitotic apparatus protein p62 n=1 Tax=Sordaria brevicollis TaxID=83679 RepID=A0AAE0PC14_SORBR|nr:hypothetical protein B0T20DRAFT_480709 [Sordaria brevicollis]